MFALDPSPHFRRTLRRFLKQHPEYDPMVERALGLLRLDPYDSRLGLHALHGPFAGQHAIRLSRAYRIRLLLVIREQTIELLDIGTHDQVY
jgi:mRNA-degrading endonuclease YafQ of YafQ-DinJ toxin-antitoxin module